MVKNLPIMHGTQVQSLAWEDPLEKGMTLHTPVFLPGEFNGERSLVGYSSWGHKKLDTSEQPTLTFNKLTSLIFYHTLISTKGVAQCQQSLRWHAKPSFIPSLWRRQDVDWLVFPRERAGTAL